MGWFCGEYDNDGDDFVLHEQVMSHPSPLSQPKRKKVGMIIMNVMMMLIMMVLMMMMMMNLCCLSKQGPALHPQVSQGEKGRGWICGEYDNDAVYIA